MTAHTVMLQVLPTQIRKQTFTGVKLLHVLQFGHTGHR